MQCLNFSKAALPLTRRQPVFGEAHGDGTQADIVRFEEAAIVSGDTVMLTMFWVRHGDEELFETWDAVDIFWLGQTGAVDEAREVS
jgi:hypothetical protein